jgi:multiple sugar transport system permease protein
MKHVTPGPATASIRPRRHRRSPGQAGFWEALRWLGPAIALIAGVVVYPVIALVAASFSTYSITGLRKGSAGIQNYVNFLTSPALPQVAWNTAVWVVCVVILTIIAGLALGQFLSKEFFGRRIVRWAVIVPWAAALVITSQLFRLMLDYYHGIFNEILMSIGIISQPIDWLGDPALIMPTMIAVGVFVSIPFTAFLIVAGLNAIPGEVYEAARIDGAGRWTTYTHITLPLLRPALLIGVVLNMIYVFNSFPVVWILNGSNPGLGNDTLITYMYKLAFVSAEHDVGLSAAAGIFNVIIIMIAVAVYLRFVNWRGGEHS